MGSFRINGGKSLKGVIYPQGAKNEALQILCAVLLSDENITIENVPDIKDVNLLIDLSSISIVLGKWIFLYESLIFIKLVFSNISEGI